MNSLWNSRASNDAAPASKPPVADVADTGIADVSSDQSSRSGPDLPARPLLQRNAQGQAPPAVPPPPNQPPPVPANLAAGQQPPDSLSLAQLKRIVADFPRSEAVAYDFSYEDFGPVEEEIDEWFVYQFWQWVRLNATQRAFDWQWERDFGNRTWEEAGLDAQKSFVRTTLNAVSSPDSKERAAAVSRLTYIVLGRWGSTACVSGSTAPKGKTVRSTATLSQLDAIKNGVQLIGDLGGIETIWPALRKAFEPFWAEEDQLLQPAYLQEAQDELLNLMTIMYITLQETLSHPHELSSVHTKLCQLNPSLIEFLVDATAKLRWEEGGLIPQAQVFLLFWKSILVVFGGLKELDEAKKATRESSSDEKNKDTITASPLDYHVFRQEITSKYPAYIPPQPAIPLEAEHTSLLPPLPNHPTRNNGSNGILPGPPNNQAGGASILHQPVHIATPAPSPPPSPGVGGKGGKKQNYQTNQNFPFMYPPLDATSNSLGGKGNTAIQDALVARRWEGSDVPASILEAGEIFSRRVRTTRAARQLWEEREKFLKFERGWDAADSDILDELDLSSLTLEEQEELGITKPKHDELVEAVDYGPNSEISDIIKRRLEAVETFYGDSLPQLQSLIITLLKAILAHWQVLMSQPPPPQQQGMPGQNNPRPNGVSMRNQEGPNGASGPLSADTAEQSAEEVDAARTREITAKAVTGIMLLLLKWLKLSHVLKFEYLTQLLLDCNYLPLVLKLFAHQDVQQVVESKSDRLENSFFSFCHIRAGGSDKPAEVQHDEPVVPDEPEEEEESEDDAAPPPIKRRRSPAGPTDRDGNPEPSAKPEGQQSIRPEVDELGYPVNPLPKEPITDFSRRNFFTLINYLRIMQKICKNKAHRNLLLVHYKSSQLLRKNLKVPQEELRLYTLKLFKNQVPYCGRKWRQSNMRVITAVYLHCRPELRDEWLAGSDVDAEVEEALPLEQALRSLTHWFNVRRYPDKMASEVRDALKEEQDFFVRELDKVDFSWAEIGENESVTSEWDYEAAHWG